MNPSALKIGMIVQPIGSIFYSSFFIATVLMSIIICAFLSNFTPLY